MREVCTGMCTERAGPVRGTDWDSGACRGGRGRRDGRVCHGRGVEPDSGWFSGVKRGGKCGLGAGWLGAVGDEV